MFRNQYDTDVTTFSPQGRLHQVEYALEAVKQGSPCVGIKSNTHVVLLALQRRAGGPLSGFQTKIFQLDNHLGLAFSGLTSDARLITEFVGAECLESKMMRACALPVSRATNAVADKAQFRTQVYGSRPYGVGCLFAGVDETGTHLHDVSPAGIVHEYVAYCIGSRSQSARTYLEANMPFDQCSLSELIAHGLMALRSTLQSDKTMDLDSVALAVVSPKASSSVVADYGVLANSDIPFKIYSKAEIEPFFNAHLQAIKNEPVPMDTE